MKNREVRVKGETDNYSICQPAAHRMIVHVLLYLTTVVVRLNQGPCRNMGGNMFRLDFLVLLCQDKRTNNSCWHDNYRSDTYLKNENGLLIEKKLVNMETLNKLINYGNPALINRNLRYVLFEYMEEELRIGSTAPFVELLPQLNYLFNFLEEAATFKANPFTLHLLQPQAQPHQYMPEWVEEDQQLSRIVSFITATIQPEKIYKVPHPPLLHQPSVTDLIIVLPDTMQQKPFSEYETLIEAACLADTLLQFSLLQSSHLNTILNEGHIFYSNFCTAQNLIYGKKEMETPKTSVEIGKQLKQKAMESFQKSFSRAEAFLTNAKNNQEQSVNTLAVFFLHQATELCCRALIASFLGIEKKTHSLPQLKKYCRRYTPVVQQIFPDSTPEEKRLLKLLDDAYLAARYEQEYTITQNDLDALMKKVIRLHEAILMDIKLKMAMNE